MTIEGTVNTYTQIHVHIIFAVKYRAALIDPSWQTALYRCITAIVQSRGHKMLAINGMSTMFTC